MVSSSSRQGHSPVSNFLRIHYSVSQRSPCLPVIVRLATHCCDFCKSCRIGEPRAPQPGPTAVATSVYLQEHTCKMLCGFTRSRCLEQRRNVSRDQINKPCSLPELQVLHSQVYEQRIPTFNDSLTLWNMMCFLKVYTARLPVYPVVGHYEL